MLSLNEVRVKVFYSYSHKDEYFRDRFEVHMSGLKRKNIIEQWHDRKILAGEDWDNSISQNLKSADIILFLVSADFLASDFCYHQEVLVSIERHKRGECSVVPVIIRDCDWRSSPFYGIQGLPKDMKPVDSRFWYNEDEAMMDIIRGIKKLIEKVQAKKITITDPPYEKMANFSLWK